MSFFKRLLDRLTGLIPAPTQEGQGTHKPPPAPTLPSVAIARPRQSQAEPLPAPALLHPPSFRVAAGVRWDPKAIQQMFPRCAQPGVWAPAFQKAFIRVPGFTLNGVAAVMAKVNTETGGLTRWDENLNYNSAARIRDTFGSRAGDNPEELVGNPVKLGNQVYASLGGYPGRGLGVIQLTGILNQTEFGKFLGMDLATVRQQLLIAPIAAMSGPWYIWHFGAQDRANSGDMKYVIAVVAGRHGVRLDRIWKVIHGDQQMADYDRYQKLLRAYRE